MTLSLCARVLLQLERVRTDGRGRGPCQRSCSLPICLPESSKGFPSPCRGRGAADTSEERSCCPAGPVALCGDGWAHRSPAGSGLFPPLLSSEERPGNFPRVTWPV